MEEKNQVKQELETIKYCDLGLGGAISAKA
jgi:hypothetical protein